MRFERALLAAFVAGWLAAPAVAGTKASTPAEAALKERDACFILYDLKADKLVERFGGDRCSLRQPPCSTFKVALAVMGFDRGILKDASTTFKWDGKPKAMQSWERDTDARGWIERSVVWYSQVIARRLGKPAMAHYMRDFAYGNADMSGGLETAWLAPEPGPKSTVRSSIAISADEQVAFFAKLWRDALPVASRAMALTREITAMGTLPNGFALSGKTGTGYAAKGSRRRLGWFVAHLAKGDARYVGALTFSDRVEPAAKAEYAGPEARELFKSIVASMAL